MKTPALGVYGRKSQTQLALVAVFMSEVALATDG